MSPLDQRQYTLQTQQQPGPASPPADDAGDSAERFLHYRDNCIDEQQLPAWGNAPSIPCIHATIFLSVIRVSCQLPDHLMLSLYLHAIIVAHTSADASMIEFDVVLKQPHVRPLLDNIRARRNFAYQLAEDALDVEQQLLQEIELDFRTSLKTSIVTYILQVRAVLRTAVSNSKLRFVC